MRALAVLLLMAGSAQAQSPEQAAAAAQRGMLREVPGRAATIKAPAPADAFRAALAEGDLASLAEAVMGRGLPAYLYLERLGRDGKSVMQQARITEPRVNCQSWPGFRAARGELLAVYLRWLTEDPAATFRVGVGVGVP